MNEIQERFEVDVVKVMELNEVTEEQRESNPKLENKLADFVLQVGQMDVEGSIWKNNGYINVTFPFQYRYKENDKYWKTAYNIAYKGSKRSWLEISTVIQQAYMKRIGIYEEELKVHRIKIDKKNNLGCHNCGFCQTIETPTKSETGFTEEQYRSYCNNKQEYVDEKYIKFLEEQQKTQADLYVPDNAKDLRNYVKGNHTKKDDYLQAYGAGCQAHFYQFSTDNGWVTAETKPFMFSDNIDGETYVNRNIIVNTEVIYKELELPENMRVERYLLSKEESQSFAETIADSKDLSPMAKAKFVREYVDYKPTEQEIVKAKALKKAREEKKKAKA